MPTKKTGARSKAKAKSSRTGNKKSGQQGQQWEETFRVTGDQLLKKAKELIKEGNVRRLIIKDNKGRVIIEFPLTLGVVITVLAPVLAAIGAIAALVTECTITVVREK